MLASAVTSGASTHARASSPGSSRSIGGGTIAAVHVGFGAVRVCFVLPELGASGGFSVVLGHAERLRAAGHADVDVAVLANGSLAAAARREYDVVVATWWTTASAAFDLNARRRTVLLQGLDERF